MAEQATSQRVKGHELWREGAAVDAGWRYGTSGEGKARCGCGETSPTLPSGAARKRWHREHKAEVLALGRNEQ